MQFKFSKVQTLMLAAAIAATFSACDGPTVQIPDSPAGSSIETVATTETSEFGEPVTEAEDTSSSNSDELHELTFSEITNGLGDHVALTTADGYNGSGTRFADWFESAKYVKYQGPLPSTTRRQIGFSDANGKTLFVMTDAGSQDIYLLELDGEEIWYKLITDKEI